MRTPAKCHPDLPNNGRGLCKSCWSKERWRTNPSLRERSKVNQRVWDEKNRERRREYTRRSYHKLSTEQKRHRNRIRHLRSLYGLTPEKYQELFQLQGGVCAICGNGENHRTLPVDHNHVTGNARGLLCSLCNAALSLIERDVKWTEKAKAYLSKYQVSPPANEIGGL